ncbi:MAG: alpha/beta fold hydrolase [Bryobacteraceae bacterium]
MVVCGRLTSVKPPEHSPLIPDRPFSRNRASRRWIALAIGVIYLVALAASHYLRSQLPAPPLEPGQKGRAVKTAVNDAIRNPSIRLAYRDFAAERPGDRLPLVLIHGSPGEGRIFRLFVSKYGGSRRLIVPDLPGFGTSESVVPDYSFRSHATYVWELLDALGIPKAHLLGFSMGGGVVLHMARQHPERVASITMLSAIGVQEMELLGDYTLNHVIHGAQLFGLKFLQIGVPRFGSWNDGDLGVGYARNFYDSDQRPLRGILQHYDGAMLILHGEVDPLVPVEAAREHARLAPQSELKLLSKDHFMVFQDPRPLIDPIQDFLARVESDTARTRQTADPDRLALAAAPMDARHWPKPGFVTLFVLFLGLALATFVSEDLACISAGVLVAEGRVGFIFAAGACLVGIVVGDLLLFLAGRWIGRAAVRRAPLRWFIDEARLRKASEWLQRNGAAVIFVSRFTPGTRLPTYVAAGVLHTPFWKFAGYFVIAASLWTPLVVAASAGLGMPLMRSGVLDRWPLWAKLLLGGAVMLVVVRLSAALTTYRGRRGLAGKWKRMRRWEFWPPYLTYPPVVFYILWLAIRFRGATVFTAANPGIPGGGFIGESKADILHHLEGAREWMPAFAEIGSGGIETRIAQIQAFQEKYGIGYPIVLKPDAGQRGFGVAVVRSGPQVKAYLDRATGPLVVQEYVGGVEYGVFYTRHPDEPRGRIFSITEKRMPVLSGDGVRTLEQLILDDDRAVCMADFYLRMNEKNAQRILGAGETVQLVELGTHALGSIFLDGIRHRTPELEHTVDRIAQNFEGFYFGRFDLRAPSEEDFRAGRNLKIIELNGVTSEATHIYDPAVTLRQSYRVLFAQWRIAFEIGAQNRARGVPVTGALTLMRNLLDFRRDARENRN